MDNTEPFFPEWLTTISEVLTFVFFGWVIWELIKLTAFFWHDKSKLARLKTMEFVTDALAALVTILMGLFLFTGWSDGIHALVIVRPFVGVLNALALRRLYNHFRSL